MDAKKTNLTPELKEIYDRVMNTSASPQASTPKATSEPLQPTAPKADPTPPPPPTPQPQMPVAPATPNPAPPPPTAQPQMPAAPVVDAPQPTAAAPVENPSMPALPGSAEEALTSTPARPLSEGNTFAFNGNTVNTAPPPKTEMNAGRTVKGKFKISIPMLLIAGLVFMVVWGVFWAIIFGFIKR